MVSIKMSLAYFALASSLAVAQPSPQVGPNILEGGEIGRGLRLRDQYGLAKPTGSVVIYVDSVAVHHIRSEASTIVWRSEAGVWYWDQAVESGPGGLLQVDRRLESHKTKILTDDEAHRLEGLIRSPWLYSGRVRRTGKIGIGTSLHVMSVQTPYGRASFRWDGRLRGKAGAIADIVLGLD